MASLMHFCYKYRFSLYFLQNFRCPACYDYPSTCLTDTKKNEGVVWRLPRWWRTNTVCLPQPNTGHRRRLNCGRVRTVCHNLRRLLGHLSGGQKTGAHHKYKQTLNNHLSIWPQIRLRHLNFWFCFFAFSEVYYVYNRDIELIRRTSHIRWVAVPVVSWLGMAYFLYKKSHLAINNWISVCS